MPPALLDRRERTSETNEEKTLFDELEVLCTSARGEVDVAHMTQLWNSHVVQRLDVHRMPTGNIFYKVETDLIGYPNALRKQRENLVRKERYGGGTLAYQQYLRPMMRADTSGKMSSAQSSGASSEVDGRERVGAFAHAGPIFGQGVVPQPRLPMYGMMTTPPSTFVNGGVHLHAQPTMHLEPHYWPFGNAQDHQLPTLKQNRSERQPKTHKSHQCKLCKAPMLGHGRCPKKQ